MKEILDIIDIIDSAIKQEPENSITSGGIINDGYDSQVDMYRETLENGQEWLSSYQARLIDTTQISKLKIKYTNIAGYFIEVPKSQANNLGENFTQTQSLVNAVRFYTAELKDFEKKLLEGQSILSGLEYDIFLDVREKVLQRFENIKTLSHSSGYLDFNCSLAEVSYNNRYTRPKLTHKYNLSIQGGRHMVIEHIEKDFISNNLQLDSKSFIHTITGPNMGGKSTFLRQNALIILLAHIGCFVPAEKAIIPLTDKIFSRIGASDNLYLGQSTFMVEMQEVANILSNSTSRSFVIIDEVGRGTSTFDGMSLAWSILKKNHDHTKAKTLFATHYHELIEESKALKGVQNFSVAVGENDENIVFLRKIVPGGIKKSYGLEVAKLAGISEDVILEARKMLLKLESLKSNNQLSLVDVAQLDIIKPQSKEITQSLLEKEIINANTNDMTPLEALNFISELKNKL